MKTKLQSLLEEYNELTAHNLHYEALVLLAVQYGTEKEIEVCKENLRISSIRGEADPILRNEAHLAANKYYAKLLKDGSPKNEKEQQKN